MVRKLPASGATLQLDFDKRRITIDRRRSAAAKESGLVDTAFSMAEVTGVELEAPASNRTGRISFYVRRAKLVSPTGADLTLLEFMDYPAYYQAVMELYRLYPAIVLYNRVTPGIRTAPGPAESAGKEESPENEQVRRLGELGGVIGSPAVAARVCRIQALAQRILDVVGEKPEKKQQARKFLQYYLPATLKLLETYVRTGAQPVQAPSIREAREDIEQVLDTLAAAYERQLDSLFADEALDITTDVRVLEAMLAGDGLTAGPSDRDKK